MRIVRIFRVLFTMAWFLGWPLFWMFHFLNRESELYAAILLTVFCAAAPRLAKSIMERPLRLLHRLAARPRLAAIGVGVAVLAIRAALLPVFPPPIPTIHDEAAYLLAGDTFASGRVTNPPHPMWVHLESIHVLHRPTYTAKYPPAQGLALSFGELLGHPWIGVWLSTGLMCSLLVWMLQAWLPLRWALYGGVLAAARLGIWSYWMNSYWGGSVATIGGLLVFGALPRLRRKVRPSLAFLMGLGLVIMANSRPYEGFFVGMTVFVAVIVWFWKDYRGRIALWLRTFALPVLLVLCVGLAGMAYYNWRTTGNALKTPYLAHRQTYSVSPLFVWQGARQPPKYNHPIHESVYRDYAMGLIEKYETVGTYLARRFTQHLLQWNFLLGPLLTIPWALVPWLVTDRRMGLPFVTLCVGMAAVSVTVSFNVHYWGPFVGVIWLIITQSVRHLRCTRLGGRRFGAAYAALLPGVMVVMLVVCGVERTQATPGNTIYEHGLRCAMPQNTNPMYKRELVRRRLAQTPGSHLVLVRYGPDHDPHEDWVFNRADIDASKIVWAYDMGAERNRELIEYYHGRIVWLAEPDAEPYRLTRYADSAAATGP